MAKARTLVGLDVHATKIVAAVLDADGRPARTERACIGLWRDHPLCDLQR